MQCTRIFVARPQVAAASRLAIVNAQIKREQETPRSIREAATGYHGDFSPDSSGQALPDAGISSPTIFGIFLGFLLIIASVLLAL